MISKKRTGQQFAFHVAQTQHCIQLGGTEVWEHFHSVTSSGFKSCIAVKPKELYLIFQELG